MITFAFEHSTICASLALLQDERVLMERNLPAAERHSQGFFLALEQLWNSGEFDPASIALFAVGIGPGAFSALRMTLTAARGLALPDGKPVVGVPSSEALAADVLAETGAAQVTILGDARRDRLWVAAYEHGAELPQPLRPLELLTWDELGRRAAEDPSLWVTPDWDRIGARLAALRPAGGSLIRESRVPRARAVGALAARKQRLGRPTDPPLPIYLHPPVSVEPRAEAPGSGPVPGSPPC